MNGKWIVVVKGNRERGGFEISIVRENNEHGRKSYGWFGADKLLVTHSGAGCVHMTRQIWDWQVAIANEVAEKLNATEEQFTQAGELDRHPYARGEQ
jgi:hypothetical protein